MLSFETLCLKFFDPLMSNSVTLSGKVNFKLFAAAYKSDYLSLNEQQHNYPDTSVLGVINLTSCTSTGYVHYPRCPHRCTLHSNTVITGLLWYNASVIYRLSEILPIVVLPDATNEKGAILPYSIDVWQRRLVLPWATMRKQKKEPAVVGTANYIEIPLGPEMH
jgi:hypothetical protein